jgi:hypothetical protein
MHFVTFGLRDSPATVLAAPGSPGLANNGAGDSGDAIAAELVAVVPGPPRPNCRTDRRCAPCRPGDSGQGRHSRFGSCGGW